MTEYLASTAPVASWYGTLGSWVSGAAQSGWFPSGFADATAAGDQRAFFLLAMALAHSAPFFFLNSMYTVLSALTTAAFKRRWRFQGEKRTPVGLLLKAIAYTTAFHLVIFGAFIFLVDPLLRWHPALFEDSLLPTLPTFLLQLVVSYASTDFFFYWGHRLLHYGEFYKRIHKQHHEFYVSVGWAAEYAHPIELLIGNVFPVLSGPLLLRFHAVVWITWMLIAIAGTTVAHSGFWYPSTVAGYHDFHHSHNTGNFGSSPLWDTICGTNKAWRLWRAKQQQRREGSSVSADERRE